MAFFEWEDRFSVGVREMDEQHQRLIKLINELHESSQPARALTARASAVNELETIASSLDEMIAYTYHHLETEEEYLAEFGYPRYDEHRRAHKRFTDRIDAFKRDFDQGKALASAELLGFLQAWWTRHIVKVDRAYGPFLNRNGVT